MSNSNKVLGSALVAGMLVVVAGVVYEARKRGRGGLGLNLRSTLPVADGKHNQLKVEKTAEYTLHVPEQTPEVQEVQEVSASAVDGTETLEAVENVSEPVEVANEARDTDPAPASVELEEVVSEIQEASNEQETDGSCPHFEGSRVIYPSTGTDDE